MAAGIDGCWDQWLLPDRNGYRNHRSAEWLGPTPKNISCLGIFGDHPWKSIVSQFIFEFLIGNLDHFERPSRGDRIDINVTIHAQRVPAAQRTPNYHTYQHYMLRCRGYSIIRH